MNNKLGNQGKQLSPRDQLMALTFIPETPNQCWLWLGTKDKKGYGKILRKANGRRRCFRADRMSYLIFVGPIPKGMFVCHNCPTGDNPSCVNTGHLWLGSNSDNMKDAHKKGRIVYMLPPPKRGSLNCAAKLKEDQVIEIRSKYASGIYTQYQLAEGYGVCQRTICLIVRREKWTHI